MRVVRTEGEIQMLHVETVLSSTLDLLREIQSHPALSDMRLVGGTALALQLGHRASVDLDLFGRFNPSMSFKNILQSAGHSVEGAETGEVQTLFVDGIKVDLVNYPYDWIANPVSEEGVVLAGMDDIVAMKLSAAANRGKKKDFIDIVTLLDRYPLAEMFARYQQKFAVSEISFALRGLTYFDDAEDDPMPKMFTSLTWDETKSRMQGAVRDFVKFVD